jgi:hypothetical protein
MGTLIDLESMDINPAIKESKVSLAKIKILLQHDENDPNAWRAETLWAIDLGDNLYKLNNSPFFAYGISCDDVVYAPFNVNEGFPIFERIVTKSGNRTVRINFDSLPEPGNHEEAVLKHIKDAGYAYEKCSLTFIAVETGPDGDFDGLLKYLTAEQIEWEYADPTFEQINGIE